MSYDGYRIPKKEIVVEVLLVSSSLPQKQALLLDAITKTGQPETLSEYLKRDLTFIPSKKFISGINTNLNVFIFYNINRIHYIREIEKTATGKNPELLYLSLVNNQNMKLSIPDEIKDQYSRVMDYLNNKSMFLQFIFHGSRIFINKNSIDSLSFVR